MAPLATEPRQMLVVLNPARRKALYQLTDEITIFMRSQLEVGAGKAPSPNDAKPSGGGGDDSWDDGWDDEPQAEPEPATRELVALRTAALAHLGRWRTDVLTKLKEVASAADDGKIVDARKKRADRIASARADTPRQGENLLDFGDDSISQKQAEEDRSKSFRALQQFYHPIPTRLTTIPVEDRREVLSCVLLLLLSSGNYSAYSRVLAVYLASALELPLSDLITQETEIAKSLVETSAAAEKQMSADAEAQKRKQEGQSSRYWKVGLASVAGAAVIGITGGLAAPVVAGAIGGLMGSVGLGGVASFLGIFWMNGALVGTLFGAFGARMTGEMMDQYAREVEDFRFIPLKDEWGVDYRKETAAAAPTSDRRLRVIIGINGWLTSKEDVTRHWRCLSDDAEVFGLRFEMGSLLALGQSLQGLVSSYAWSMIKMEILKRTVLASLSAALWPAYLLKTASAVDNPFNLARNRSEKAGRILADAIANKVQGERPVTLVGYSLGARVIYTCLRALAQRRAFGLVDTVVFVGAPVPSDAAHWRAMRSVVSGRLFNVYSENDYILGFLYRATSIQLGVAGLQPVEGVDGVENLDLSDDVKGHLRYPDLMPQILARCGFPGVQGGDGPIEKEKDDDITLREQDGSGAVGMLIELDDLPSEAAPLPALPSRPQQTGPGGAGAAALPQRNSRRPVVVRTESETLMRELDPLGSLSLESTTAVKPLARPARSRPDLAAAAKTEPVVPTAASLPTAAGDASPETTAGAAAANVKGQKEGEVAVPPPKSQSVPPQIESSWSWGEDEGEEDDDDEEGFGGIKMMDNDDDMVTYDEPLMVED